RLWTARFGRNRSTIGRPLTLDGMNFTIIGVMPSDFSGADIGLHADIVVPLSWEPRIYPRPCLNSKYCWWLVVMGRLRPGVSLEEANAQLRVISPVAMETAIYPGMPAKEQQEFLARKVVAQSGATGFSFLRFRFNNPLLVLMILVSLVLLIACANLASLLLARATARQREITVRLAIGAGRWRLIRQMLTESLLLSAAGGLLGVLLASGLSRFLKTFFSLGQEPILLNLTPDWRVLTFLFFASVMTAVLFGIAPAIRATRVEIHAGLKEGSRTVQNSDRRRPLTKLLLAGQVALSVLLVTGAGLFTGSLMQLRSLDRGFDPRGVVLFPLSVDARIGGQPEKDEPLATRYQQLLKRLEALPGVEAASLMNIVPLGNGGWDNEISIPAGLPETLRTVFMNKIAPHYFAMMHTPLLAGRDFNEHDTESSAHVAILNERAAREYFPRGNAIGSQIGNSTHTLTVVGIVGDAKYMNLRDEIPRTMYVPYSQNLEDLHSMTVGVRVKGDPAAIMTAIRPILRAVIPGIAMPQPLLMTDQMNQSLSMERLMALLTLFFGLLALILTSIGLYGTLAYAVTRRTAEIGIRMALGAERRRVIWLVLRENATLTITGLVVGIAAVLVMSRLISGLLYGITPHDPLALSMAVLVLAAVAAVASLLPALRASRIDPMTALRYE
ncbi:MAG: ABC transporter permease, partial [Bryobacteraceae bacterium]